MLARKRAMFVTPGNQTREERRAQRDAIARLVKEEKEQRPRKAKIQLPPAAVGVDSFGLLYGGYWNPLSMTIPAHQATSHNLAGIYPFVADTGMGERGPIIGVDLNADALMHFSPWDAYNDPTERGTFSTNILVLGAYRAGKSGTIKTLVFRSLALGHKAVVPSDSKGEWVSLARAVPGGIVYTLGGSSTTRMNPLDSGPRRSGVSDGEHEKLVLQRRITTLVTLVQKALNGRGLEPEEHEALSLALNLAISTSGDRPTLRRVHEQLRVIESGAVGAEALVVRGAVKPRLALNRFITGDLAGLFEDESSVSFDAVAPIVVVDTSELFQRGDLAAQIAQVCTTAWIQAVISDRDSHDTRYVIREEGWRDMSSIESLQMYQQWLKLSRHYGISNIVILHKMGDLDAVGEEGSQERNLAYSVVGDIENKFIFRVNQQEEDSLQQRLNLPPQHVMKARTLRKGEFLAYIGSFVYVVDCFATSTPLEYQLFKTDDAIQTDRDIPATTVMNDLDALWPIPAQSREVI